MRYSLACAHFPQTAQCSRSARASSSIAEARICSGFKTSTSSFGGGACNRSLSGPISFLRHHFGECWSRFSPKYASNRITAGMPGSIARAGSASIRLQLSKSVARHVYAGFNRSPLGARPVEAQHDTFANIRNPAALVFVVNTRPSQQVAFHKFVSTSGRLMPRVLAVAPHSHDREAAHTRDLPSGLCPLRSRRRAKRGER